MAAPTAGFSARASSSGRTPAFLHPCAGLGQGLAALVVPDVMQQGAVAFSAPAGTTLSANANYHLVLFSRQGRGRPHAYPVCHREERSDVAISFPRRRPLP